LQPLSQACRERASFLGAKAGEEDIPRSSQAETHDDFAVFRARVEVHAERLAYVFVSSKLVRLQAWAKESAVSLQFKAEERCSFIDKITREEEAPTKHVAEVSIGSHTAAAITSKVVTTITDYLWKFEVTYELTAIRGVGAEPSDRLQLLRRCGEVRLKTASEVPPRPEVKAPAISQEVNISWLLQMLQEDSTAPSFKVDRVSNGCKTPRRNLEVDAAFKHFASLTAWARGVVSYIEQLFLVEPAEGRQLDMSVLRPDSVFAPVLPLLTEDRAQSETESEGRGWSTLACIASGDQKPDSAENCLQISASDSNRLLAEETRTLEEQRRCISEAITGERGVATSNEAFLAMTLKHCSEVCGRWADAVEFVENMLRKQLVAAIGKEVTPADFAAYMKFHNRKLFREPYAPAPFCFAVRRSERHGPEGTVSIEEEVVGAGGDSNISSSILTVVAKSSTPSPMQFPLSASTTVTFGGDRYLHAWLSHQFSGASGTKLSLVSRARQFSSMMVLVGRVTSASSFEPKYAAIIQNKDELTIPLDLSTIPTPKEFKDAIEVVHDKLAEIRAAMRNATSLYDFSSQFIPKEG